MYFNATAILNIGDYELSGAHAIEIKRSIHAIVQTATVTLPLSVVFRNNEMLQRIKLTDKIKEGDPVRLSFGYDGNNKTEFEGYIKRIDYNIPLQIFCEDELYIMRKVRLKKSFGSCNLKELVSYLLDEAAAQTGVRFTMYDKMPVMVFKNFVMNNAAGTDVLQELKDKYGLRCYLTTINGNKTLFIGLAYQLEKGRVKYELGTNTVSVSELKYDMGQQKKFRITVKNYRKDGTVQKYEFGDRDGQQYEMLPQYGDYDQAHMEALATAEVMRLQAQGFRGTFETFLIPHCEPGTVAVITDPQFPERKGNYFIAATTTTLNGSGGRRKPEIGIKVSNNE